MGIRTPGSSWYLLAVLLLGSFSASSNTGRVVGVTDGDTMTVLDEQQHQHKTRLAGIDAPETRQPFGQRSKDALSEAVFGKTVTVDWEKVDRYGRIVGTVLVDDRDVNLDQVRAGYAWCYQKYAAEQSPADRELYAQAEERARHGHLGLWSEADPVSPWDWRIVTRTLSSR